MKRSEINLHLERGKRFFEQMGVNLPGYAFYTADQWEHILTSPDLRASHSEVLEKRLGWDVTNFGSGDFPNMGLLLFTRRNGISQPDGKADYSPVPYAEKLMMVLPGQVTPWHFHWFKAEDIINDGMGNLVIELYNAHARDNLTSQQLKDGIWQDGSFDRTTPVRYISEQGTKEVKPGTTVVLGPGESIRLMPRVYHTFYGDTEMGLPVLVREVSRVNDDQWDNRFRRNLPRFDTKTVPDGMPLHLLCNEYEQAANIIAATRTYQTKHMT